MGINKGYVSVQVLEECRRNLAKKLPRAVPLFEKIVERSVSITTTPPDKASLCFVSNQAEKKDVSILASAVDAKAQFLVTFNVKDYWPANTTRLEVLTPGELLSRIRFALNREVDAE